MKDSAPSPRRLQYLRDYRRRNAAGAAVAGVPAGWVCSPCGS
ncbi:MAG: hypothetical protein ACLU38_00100 [Dysosmobacter sp.]